MDNRRDLLKLALVCTAAGLPMEAKDGVLPNAIHTANDAKVDKQPFGEQRIYFQGPTAQLKSMTAGSLILYAGQEPHPPHQHPEEEFMLVTEGHGEMLVDGVKHQVSAGSMLYCEGNQLHGVKNTSGAPMKFYFYKWQA